MLDLNKFDLFQGLKQEIQTKLAQHMHCHDFPKDITIFAEGDESDSLYFILSGKIKVYLNDKTGKEYIVNIHAEGESFGELGVIENIERTASVATLEESKIAVLHGQTFKELLEENRDLANHLIHNLASRLNNATENIRRLALMDVYGRIVITFLNLSEEKDGMRIIRQKMTQQSIANHVGASREMVARILKDLKQGEYIEMRDQEILIKKPLPSAW